MQKILIEAVEIQNILYLELSNAKDFDRGYRNLKDFAFATHTSRIFSILCACADSCVPTLVCVRRLEPWNPWLPCFVTDPLTDKSKNIMDIISHKCKIFCIRGLVCMRRPRVPWFVTAPDSRLPKVPLFVAAPRHYQLPSVQRTKQ
jgi:hypothetical protein